MAQIERVFTLQGLGGSFSRVRGTKPETSHISLRKQQNGSSEISKKIGRETGMEKGKIRTGKDPSQSRVVVLPGLSPFLGVKGKECVRLWAGPEFTNPSY